MSLQDTVTVIIDNLSEQDKHNMMQGDYSTEVFDNESITVISKDSYGGEDQGSDYWQVYSFSKDNEEVFVKFNGWYASHYGTDYRDYSFVTPKEKTVVVYE